MVPVHGLPLSTFDIRHLLPEHDDFMSNVPVRTATPLDTNPIPDTDIRQIDRSTVCFEDCVRQDRSPDRQVVLSAWNLHYDYSAFERDGRHSAGVHPFLDFRPNHSRKEKACQHRREADVQNS